MENSNYLLVISPRKNPSLTGIYNEPLSFKEIIQTIVVVALPLALLVAFTITLIQ